MNLPPKALHVLVDIKRDLIQYFGDKLPKGSEIETVTPARLLPSAEDLDAVAEEERIKERTRRLEPKGSKHIPRHARSGKGMSYQRHRSRELQRIARA